MTAEALPARPDGVPFGRRALSAARLLVRRSLPDFLVHVIGQKRILKKAYPGIMHGLIFWGVTIQIVGTVINLMQMQLFLPLVTTPFLEQKTYLVYELVMDIAGLAIVAGVMMALFRRVVLRPKALETRWDDYYALILLALIPLVGFFLEAIRLLATEPAWANWSPAGNSVASLLTALGMTADTAISLHPILFWTHVVLGLALVGSIPFTKLRHLILTPLNVLLKPFRKEGTLSLIKDFEEAESFGVGQVTEFSFEQLLSFDACVRCGRCEDVCPAACSGMPYSPRSFVQALRHETSSLFASPPAASPLDTDLMNRQAWYCTTCGACLAGCPAFVNPVDAIIDLRRYQTLTTGRPPQSVANVLRSLERQGNPWGMAAGARTEWAAELGVRKLEPGDKCDVLLFLGCTFTYDERNKQVAHAFVQLLQTAGVDFATLGHDESCCGETARRLGEEYLYQTLAGQNIETLGQVSFNRIVTQCPHCFNTLKNEYPQLGATYPVQHYTQYLAELWPDLLAAANGQAQISQNGRITYHDPCYLGRYNHEYQSPRSLLRWAGLDSVEMVQRGENSFCCGGGGGQMWMESDAETRINQKRLADVMDVRANVVATACPYCLLMFDDAIRSQDLTSSVQVSDIAEILVQRLGADTGTRLS